MFKLLALATTGLFGFSAEPEPQPPADPFDVAVAAIVDYAPIACARVDAYEFATGRDDVVDRSVERFMQEWAGTPRLAELALLYRGVLVGCIASN